MNPDPRQRLPRRQQVLTQVRSQIIRLQLPPGAAISENDLAASLGVSRTPVREALLLLAEDGLVEVYAKIGSFVSRVDAVRVDEAFHRGLMALAGHEGSWSTVSAAKGHLDRARMLGITGRPLLGRFLEQHRSVLEALRDGDIDRAVRDPRDLEDLIDAKVLYGFRVLSTTGSLRLDNDSDIAMARVLVAMANKSSADTARRVARASKQQASLLPVLHIVEDEKDNADQGESADDGADDRMETAERRCPVCDDPHEYEHPQRDPRRR